MKRDIPISELKPGMILAEAVYDRDQELLIAAGIKIISARQVSRLQERGVRKVTIEIADEPQKQEQLSITNGSIPNGTAAVSREKARSSISVTTVEKQERSPTSEHHVSTEVITVEKSDTEPATENGPELKSDGISRDNLEYIAEIRHADEIKTRATKLVKNIMTDVRLGKTISTEPARAIVRDMTESIFRNSDALLSLARLKRYDEYTFNHSINVCTICLAVAKDLNYSRGKMELLGNGAILHDIGKMTIPGSILNKPGKLTPEEFEVMKTHTTAGAEILRREGRLPEESILVAEQHHERYDGSGYNAGLTWEEISEFAQIAAIVDTYDALSSDRVYKKAMLPDESIKLIYSTRNKAFSSDLLTKVIQVLGIYPAGSIVELSNGEVGIIISVNKRALLQPTISTLFSKRGRLKRKPEIIDLVEHPYIKIKRTIPPSLWKIDFKNYISSLEAEAGIKAA